jgi:hypothetical protein
MRQKKPSVGSIKHKKELLNFQRLFANIIRRPLLANEKMQKHAASNKIAKHTEKLNAHQRLELYAQQYWWRIQASFDEDYPCLQRVSPIKKYQTLRDAYLLAYPSESFTLRDLGLRFYSFVKNQKGLSTQTRQIYLDCIAYDDARIHAFDAGETNKLTETQIRDKNFSRKKLYLAPHVRLLHLWYPVQLLSQNGSTLKEMSSRTGITQQRARSGTQFKLKKQETFLALFRADERVKFRTLDPIEFRLLQLLEKGAVLQKLVSYAERKQAGEKIFTFFSEWNALGLLTTK